MKNNNHPSKDVLGKVIAGTAVGLAAGAAAVALSDKKTRTNLGKKLKNLAEKAQEGLNNVESTIASSSRRSSGKARG